MISFYLSRDFQLSIKDPSASKSTEGFKIEIYSEILSKYNQVIAFVCFDKKQTKCIFLFRDQTQLDEYSNAENWSALANRFQIKGATT